MTRFFMKRISRLRIPSFDECSICLDKMYRVKHVGVNIRKLPCGHVYHKTCVEAALDCRNVCPICQVYVYNLSDTKLLEKMSLTREDCEYIGAMSHHNAMLLLQDSMRIGNTMLTAEIVSRFDPTEVLHYCIYKRDVPAIIQLIYSKCLNWHRSFQGKTLVKAAEDTCDLTIQDIISSGKAYSFSRSV